MERVPVLVVGAGSAGLAVSHELSTRGVEHLVLDRARIGQAWRDRWDSFCLVTPNWSVRLPGAPYDGPDPDGFMPRDELVGRLEAYAASFGAPLREGVEVLTLERDGAGFTVRTANGDITARRVVLATGTYQRQHRPAGLDALPPSVPVVPVEAYRNPDALPPGGVLVIGSGQSGCQVAEELREAGRAVTLSCGRAAWAPRRVGGRDVFWWAVETGFMDMPVSELPAPGARLAANLVATGHGGGHDLHLRTLRALGVTLVGRFLGVDGDRIRFADDLAASVAWGDERYREFREEVHALAAARGLPAPDMPDPAPFDPAAPGSLSLRGLGAVVLAGGFRPAYRSWLPWPDAFDDLGFPIHEDGESTVVPGLHFIGIHFLRTRSSSILLGVGDDATVVADRIRARLA